MLSWRTLFTARSLTRLLLHPDTAYNTRVSNGLAQLLAILVWKSWIHTMWTTAQSSVAVLTPGKDASHSTSTSSVTQFSTPVSTAQTQLQQPESSARTGHRLSQPTTSTTMDNTAPDSMLSLLDLTDTRPTAALLRLAPLLLRLLPQLLLLRSLLLALPPQLSQPFHQVSAPVLMERAHRATTPLQMETSTVSALIPTSMVVTFLTDLALSTLSRPTKLVLTHAPQLLDVSLPHCTRMHQSAT